MGEALWARFFTAAPRRRRQSLMGADDSNTANDRQVLEFLNAPDAFQLLEAYSRIRVRKMRLVLIHLAISQSHALLSLLKILRSDLPLHPQRKMGMRLIPSLLTKRLEAISTSRGFERLNISQLPKSPTHIRYRVNEKRVVRKRQLPHDPNGHCVPNAPPACEWLKRSPKHWLVPPRSWLIPVPT
jgi:hypothetical protein